MAEAFRLKVFSTMVWVAPAGEGVMGPFGDT
jgi:hypothetical protein